MLNIEYALPNNSKEYFHTNYKNIEEITYNVIDSLQKHLPGLLIISDISFSDNRKELLKLINTSKRTNTKILFLDHHVYSDGFFNDLDINYVHDINRSATKITNDYFKNSNKNLDKLTNLIDIFDIWKINEDDINEAVLLNEFFWKYVNKHSIYDLMILIKNNDYKLPDNYEIIKSEIERESLKYIESLENKNLIHRDGFTTISFMDEYITEFSIKEFNKNTEVILIVHSYGVIRVRFNTISNLTDEFKLEVKKELNSENKGHLNAFPIEVKNSSFTNIMNEVKRIIDIINKVKERYDRIIQR